MQDCSQIYEYNNAKNIKTDGEYYIDPSGFGLYGFHSVKAPLTVCDQGWTTVFKISDWNVSAKL